MKMDQLDQARLDLADRIVLALTQRTDLAGKNISLGSGTAGIALYLSEWEARAPSRNVTALLDALIGHIHTTVSSLDSVDLTMFNGLPGVAFALEHIAMKRGASLADRVRQNEDIDELVLHVLEGHGQRHHDLVSGLAGLGVYALARADTVARDRIFGAVYRQLMASAVHDGAVPRWVSRVPFQSAEHAKTYPEGHYDLGMAHGQPGVLAMLCRALETRVAHPDLRATVSGLAHWMARLASTGGKSAYGYALGDGGHSRSAWCYGDPGIALVLLRCADVLDDGALRQAAMAIALRSAERDDSSAGVVDSGLCHGRAGLSVLFRRMFHVTGRPEFIAAARRWETNLLAAPDTLTSAPGLVEGLSGIGMSLIEPDTGGDWSLFLGI